MTLSLGILFFSFDISNSRYKGVPIHVYSKNYLVIFKIIKEHFYAVD